MPQWPLLVDNYVHGFGLLLFIMLTGGRPYEAERFVQLLEAQLD